MFFLITQQKHYDDGYGIIEKTCLYVKDLYEAKYKYLIKKNKNKGLKNLRDKMAFIKCSKNMQDVLKSFEEYIREKKKMVLIVHLVFIEIYIKCNNIIKQYMINTQ